MKSLKVIIKLCLRIVRSMKDVVPVQMGEPYNDTTAFILNGKLFPLAPGDVKQLQKLMEDGVIDTIIDLL